MCKWCGHELHLKKIEDLMRGGKHRWAYDTLNGIRQWVDLYGHITDKQKQVVAKIGKKR